MKSVEKLLPHIPAFLFAAALVLAGLAPAAYADCAASCMTDHDCGTESEAGHLSNLGKNCVAIQKDCKAHCSNGNSVHGAIAYDKKSGAWGMSGAFPDEKGASDDALRFCTRHGSGCEIVSAFADVCAAVAQGNATNALKWATAVTPQQARREAQSSCIEATQDSCEIKRWQCYGVH